MSFTRGVPFQLLECLNPNKTQILLFEKQHCVKPISLCSPVSALLSLWEA